MTSASIANDTRQAVSAIEAGRTAIDPELGAQLKGKTATANGTPASSNGSCMLS
jgi:hypothetical protein